MNRTRIYLAVSSALACATGDLAITGVAEAASSDGKSASTGSQLRHVSNGSHVTVHHRDEILRTGLTSVGDFLQQLTVSGAALSTRFNNGGNGETRADLHNLGSRRVLVLINGRRLQTGLSSAVDLNNIPLSVVSRVEVLNGSASAIYGMDAIAGVVNIITRGGFEGVELNAQIGQFESGNDGEKQSFDLSLGAASDRGSIYFNASYTQDEPVLAGDRLISAEPQFGTGNALGSSATPQGRFGFLNPLDNSFSTRFTTDPGTQVTGPGGLGLAAFRIGDFSFGPVGAGSDRYNFAPFNFLLTPLERTSIFSQGSYQFSDHIRLTAEAQFSTRSSTQQLAPSQLFLGIFDSGGPGGQVGVGALNPFNPLGVDIPASSWLLARRLVEAGNRQFNQEVDYYRFNSGLEGSFDWAGRPFEWVVDYDYQKINRNDLSEGLVSIDRVAQALSNDCVTGAIPGCVPLNVFGGQGPDGHGTITAEMLDFIGITTQDTYGNESRQYSALLTGELFELPAGSLNVAVGYDYRQIEGFDVPDALTISGATSGSFRSPTMGEMSSDDFFVELAVPLLENAAAARRLDLTLAARRTDYDLLGDTVNSSIALQWQPIDDLLIRASVADGAGTPSLTDLFGGQQRAFPTIVDPCNGIDTDGDGLPDTNPGLPGCAGVPGSYVQPGVQIPVLVGGNPRLGLEEAETRTLGLMYEPAWLDGLSISVQYTDIEIEGAIAPISGTQVLNACTTSLRLCSQITRDPNTGQVLEIFAGRANRNSIDSEFIDILVDYDFPETGWGQFSIDWQSHYLRSYDLFQPAFSGFA